MIKIKSPILFTLKTKKNVSLIKYKCKRVFKTDIFVECMKTRRTDYILFKWFTALFSFKMKGSWMTISFHN